MAHGIGLLDPIFDSLEGSVNGHVSALLLLYLLIRFAFSGWEAGLGVAVAISGCVLASGVLYMRVRRSHGAIYVLTNVQLVGIPLATFLRFYGCDANGVGSISLALDLMFPWVSVYITKYVELQYTPLFSSAGEKPKDLQKVVPLRIRQAMQGYMLVYLVVIPSTLMSLLSSGEEAVCAISSNPATRTENTAHGITWVVTSLAIMYTLVRYASITLLNDAAVVSGMLISKKALQAFVADAADGGDAMTLAHTTRMKFIEKHGISTISSPFKLITPILNESGRSTPERETPSPMTNPLENSKQRVESIRSSQCGTVPSIKEDVSDNLSYVSGGWGSSSICASIAPSVSASPTAKTPVNKRAILLARSQEGQPQDILPFARRRSAASSAGSRETMSLNMDRSMASYSEMESAVQTSLRQAARRRRMSNDFSSRSNPGSRRCSVVSEVAERSHRGLRKKRPEKRPDADLDVEQNDLGDLLENTSNDELSDTYEDPPLASSIGNTVATRPLRRSIVGAALSPQAQISYEDQLFTIWNVVDGNGTGYLHEEDVLSVLQICGVNMVPEIYEEFLRMSFGGAEMASFLSFCAAFEDCRTEDVFATVHCRIRLAAMIERYRDPRSQLRAQRICEDVSTTPGTLLDDELIEALRRLNLPYHWFDIQLLKEELGIEGAVDASDFVTVFTCFHPLLIQEAIEPEVLQQARKALQRRDIKAVYSTSEQTRRDAAAAEQESLTKRIPVVFAYTFTTFVLCIMEAAFHIDHSGHEGIIIGYLVSDVLYAAYLCHKMIMPYEEGGHLELNRSKIVKRYLKSSGALTDLICLFPLDLVGIALESRIARNPLYRLNKAILIVNLNGLASASFAKLMNSPTSVRILQSFFWVVMQMHVLSCVFKLVAEKEGDFKTAKITTVPFYSTLTTALQYLQAADYAIKTMSGLSRGQPMPETDWQTLNALLTCMTGVAAYAYFLSTVSHVTQMKSQSSMLTSKVDSVKGHLQYKKVPKEFLEECISYYKHVFATTGFVQEGTLDDLPRDLEILVNVITCRSMLSKVPIFLSACDNGEFVYALSLKLRPETMSPGQVVTEKGAVGSTMYFIIYGEFELQLADLGVGVLQAGNFFGEIALLYSVRRTATITALRFCNVLRLEKQDFEEVAELFPVEMRNIRSAARDRIAALIHHEKLKDDSEEVVPILHSPKAGQRPRETSVLFSDGSSQLSHNSGRSEDVVDWVEKTQNKESNIVDEDSSLKIDRQKFCESTEENPFVVSKPAPRNPSLRKEKEDVLSREPSSMLLTKHTFVGKRVKMLGERASTQGMSLQEQRTFAENRSSQAEGTFVPYRGSSLAVSQASGGGVCEGRGGEGGGKEEVQEEMFGNSIVRMQTEHVEE